MTYTQSMNKFTSLFGLVLLLVANYSFAQNTDLELTATLTSEAPLIYDIYSIDYTLTNTGDAIATGIEVNVPLPSGTVYQGGSEFSLTAGDFFPSFLPDIPNSWSIDQLAAGESVTLSTNFFLLTSNPVFHYAEVISVNETDLDSTPDNGNNPTVEEDDEAIIILPLPDNPDCTISLEISALDCNDAGTSDQALDDTFTYSLTATGEDTGDSFTLLINGENPTTQTYDTPINFDGGLIAEADSIIFTIVDNSNAMCTATATLAPPRHCSADVQIEGIDLELTLEAVNPQVLVFQSSIFLLTITNAGTEIATGVNVFFPMDLDNDIVFTEAEYPVPSKGFYNPFEDDIWYIDTLLPGEKATITADLFFLTKPFLYAEAINLDGEDGDSEVANGDGMTAREDDEVVFGNEIGTNCNIVIAVTNKVCYDGGMPFETDDDLFVFSFVAYGESSSETYHIIEPAGYPFEISYGAEGQSLGVLPIVDGSVTLTLQDRSNEACTTSIEIEPTAPCSGGGLITPDGEQVYLEINDATLFPTAVKDIFTVGLNTDSPAVSVQIINMQGQIVYHSNWLTVKGLQQKEIAVSHLVSGSYFVQITGTDWNRTLRFVK